MGKNKKMSERRIRNEKSFCKKLVSSKKTKKNTKIKLSDLELKKTKRWIYRI